MTPLDVTKSVNELSSQITASNVRLLQSTAETLEEMKRILSRDHVRILEYFYNRRTHETLDSIPLSVIYFFECADYSETLRPVLVAHAATLISELQLSGYVKKSMVGKSDTMLELTTQGVLFMERRHPRALVWWTKLIESVPSTSSLIITIVGLAASILGIVDFAYHHV